MHACMLWNNDVSPQLLITFAYYYTPQCMQNNEFMHNYNSTTSKLSCDALIINLLQGVNIQTTGMNNNNPTTTSGK